MKHITTIFVSLTAMIWLITSCNTDEVFYSEFIDIPEEGIPDLVSFTFSPVPTDSCRYSEKCNVILIMRYSPLFQSSDLLLDIEELSLNTGHPDSTFLRIKMFDEKGRPKGKGRYGIHEIRDTIHKNVYIAPGYEISVSTPLPSKFTSGLKSLGIMVTTSKK